jgi:hypothetical protein
MGLGLASMEIRPVSIILLVGEFFTLVVLLALVVRLWLCLACGGLLALSLVVGLGLTSVEVSPVSIVLLVSERLFTPVVLLALVVWLWLCLACRVLLALSLVVGLGLTSMEICPMGIILSICEFFTLVVFLALVVGHRLCLTCVLLALALVMASLNATASECSNEIRSLHWSACLETVSQLDHLIVDASELTGMRATTAFSEVRLSLGTTYAEVEAPRAKRARTVIFMVYKGLWL